MKRAIIQFTCAIFVVSFTCANEKNLAEDFNDNVTLLTKQDQNAIDYNPSIQLAVNDKSRVQRGYIEDILRNERLLRLWSNRLSNKHSGHYLVLMSSENKNPTLVDIAKFQPTTTIQASDLKIEIVSREARIENKNCYDLKSDVTYISSYNIASRHYWLYSLIIR